VRAIVAVLAFLAIAGSCSAPPTGQVGEGATLRLTELASVTLPDQTQLGRVAVQRLPDGVEAIYLDRQTQSVYRVRFADGIIEPGDRFESVVGLEWVEGDWVVLTVTNEWLVGATYTGTELWRLPINSELPVTWVGWKAGQLHMSTTDDEGHYLLWRWAAGGHRWQRMWHTRKVSEQSTLWVSGASAGWWMVETDGTEVILRHMRNEKAPVLRYVHTDARMTSSSDATADFIVGLPPVALDRGAIVPIWELPTGRRIWVRYDVDGEPVRTSRFDAEFVPLASDEENALMVMSRMTDRYEVVLYSWSWGT